MVYNKKVKKKKREMGKGILSLPFVFTCATRRTRKGGGCKRKSVSEGYEEGVRRRKEGRKERREVQSISWLSIRRE